MIIDFKKKRKRLQSLTWAGLPMVIIGGWFFPKLGFFLLLCMAGAIGVALYKGRAWCDWMCPRGSFYDLFIQRFSLKREIPSVIRNRWFRTIILALMLGVLGTQVYLNWGDLNRIGTAMVKLLTVTTSAGIILGLFYHQRVWCHICPMGTLSYHMSEGKRPLKIEDACSGCKVCAKVCPMQLKPYQYKAEGIMGDKDCIKCAACVAVCPKKILGFSETRKKAA